MRFYDILRYDLPRFFMNMWVQRKALWGARSYDHSGVYLYMRNQLDHMSKTQRKHGYHLNKDKHCDRMDVCVRLLDRLIADEYDIERWDFKDEPNGNLCWDITPKYDFPATNHSVYKRDDKQRDIDKKYLFDTLDHYLHHWWD